MRTSLREILIHGQSDAWRTSYVYAGILDYASAHQVETRFKFPWSKDGLRLRFSDPAVLAYNEEGMADIVVIDLVRENGQPLRIAFDVSDHSCSYDAGVLGKMDLYFKRSFFRPDLKKLGGIDKNKVRPLGLPFAIRSDQDKRVLLRVLGYFSASGRLSLRKPNEFRKSCQAVLSSVGSFLLRAGRAADHEINPATPLRPAILFQTRLWGTSVDPTLAELNQRRAELVRALRESFGKQSEGGLIADAVARQNYPDLLTTLPTRHREFLNVSREQLIGISTRGLHQSTPWKIPEYFAQSKCVISEPIRNEAQAPLVAGEHYLAFTSVPECLDACRRVLLEPKLALRLRQAGFAYYQQYIKPANWFGHCLAVALDKPGAGADREII